jgi:carboxyl-terminal processing protease
LPAKPKTKDQQVKAICSIVAWISITSGVVTPATAAPRLGSHKTQVVIVGTIHARHNENPQYSPEVLRDIISHLRPAAILNELPLSQVDPNGRPLFRDRDKHPEGWAADTVATQLGVKQIPFDQPDREQDYRKTDFFARQKRSIDMLKQWAQELQENHPECADLKTTELWWDHVKRAEAHLLNNASPQVINSETHDSIIRIKSTLRHEIIPALLTKYPAYEAVVDDCRFLKDHWEKRNQIMVDNILRAAKEFPGKRLVVVTGATHRYILRDLLKDEPFIELKEYWETTGTAPKFDPAQCFDKVWEIVNEGFWDPNFNGVDWEDAKKRYRPLALAATDHEAFARVVNQMLGELKTSHTRYFTKWDPGYYTLQVVFGKPDSHRNGIGVVTKRIGGRYYVSAVLASSSAEKAGIVLGDLLIEVDGRPFHPIRSFENRAGQELEIAIQRGPAESTRRKLKVTPVDMKEEDRLRNDSHASLKTIEYKGHRFAYVRLWWLRGLQMKQVLEYGIYRANEAEGIIIDIRDGFGGDMGYEYIAPFLQYGLGEITVESTGRDRVFKSIAGCNKPVVVLTNGGSRSGKETLAYLFKKTGRGILVGEKTAGFVTGGRNKAISSDSFLYYGAFKMIVDGKNLEGVGVEPDIEVPFDIRFAAARDIQLERAKDEMVKLIEAGQSALSAYAPLDKYAPASLGSLQTRDRIIRLEIGSRISILDLSGQPIAMFLNETQLRSEFPELYEAFKNLLAIGQSEDLILDASINKP